jgi:surfactin synthase thioesterase subunit
VPFAGGSAVSYVALARHLSALDPGIRTLGVELPQRSMADSRGPVPAANLAGELADEIIAEVDTPVVLLGHCAGTGPALLTAHALRARGVDVTHLFAVAKVLKSADPEAHAANEVVHMSQTDILSWLVDNTGFAELDGLTDAGRADLAEAFRYDTAEASAAYARALLTHDRPATPITAVFAEDDLLVRGHEAAVDTWSLFGELRVVTTPEGGHYLNATRPELLASCVLDVVAERSGS